MAGNVLSHITCSERQIADGPQVLELGQLSPSVSHLRIFHGSLTRRFLAAILYISALSKKRPSYCKDSVVESRVCGSVSEFDIAGTGDVYIKACGGTLCFSSSTLGLTI